MDGMQHPSPERETRDLLLEIRNEQGAQRRIMEAIVRALGLGSLKVELERRREAERASRAQSGKRGEALLAGYLAGQGRGKSAGAAPRKAESCPVEP